MVRTFRFFSWAAFLLSVVPGVALGQTLPDEPLFIGTMPQYVMDNHVVDNHWAIRSKQAPITRVFHSATKHESNPLIPKENASYTWVVRDEETGRFRMWYQANIRVEGVEKGKKYQAQVAYAESQDGVKWTKPDLKLFPGFSLKPNNVVLAGPPGKLLESSAPCLLEVPEKDRRGFKYLMLYRSKGGGGGDFNGIRLVGSQDGIHWDAQSDTRLAHLHSDCPNTISYDPHRKEYVMYCRPKHIYRTFRGDIVDTGASRRIAWMTSKTLWTDWLETSEPQTLLIPDEIDAKQRYHFFYGMPTRYRDGVYWGFLEPFRLNDFIYSELAFSRDGIHFTRHPFWTKLIEYGPEGTWDDTMIFASPGWVEVGDEWWIYYSGWDGPHGTAERIGGIGLAKIRKEGFVSLRSPTGGGVVCTRKLIWPGGDLLINANAGDGELRVRVSGENRKVLGGFDYPDCQPLTGRGVRQKVSWKNGNLDRLKGQSIRLEFQMTGQVDLFTFSASGK